MGELIQDVQLAIRGFWRAPVFTIGAILTLTLAIGANTAIFSLLNALVLRDLPVREPSSLVSLARATPTTADGAFSLPMFRAVAERQQSLSALIGWTSNSVINVEIDDVRTRGNVSAVTGNYFTELGIQPVAGRLLTDTDVAVDTLRSAPIAVIGHGFWQRHFNRDPAAVGRTLRVEGTPFTIVGVAPSGFRGLGLTLEIDVAVPLTFVPLVRDVPSRAFVNGTANSISLTGRLRPGVTLDQARAELTTSWPAVLTAAMPPEYAGAQRQRFLETTIQVREGAKGVEPGLRRRFTQPLVIVMTIALFVVLIACVNIASLMMSRASARMHEMGVRLALGAGSWRLIRIVLVEGVLLSLVGALFGVLVAMWGSESLVAVILATYTVPPSFDVHPDLRVMGFTIGLAVVVGLLFSVAPAWRVGRASAAVALQRSTRTATRSGRAGRILVAVQVGLSLVLLINAGLLVRSLQAIRAVDSGLRTDDVFVVYPAPSRADTRGSITTATIPPCSSASQRYPECAAPARLSSSRQPAVEPHQSRSPASAVPRVHPKCRRSGRRCRRGSSTRWVCRSSPAAISSGAITRAAGGSPCSVVPLPIACSDSALPSVNAFASAWPPRTRTSKWWASLPMLACTTSKRATLRQPMFPRCRLPIPAASVT